MSDSHLVYENPHFRIERLTGVAIVRVTRLPRAFESSRDALVHCRPMLDKLDVMGRSGRLLFDSRQAIGNNDPEYESWFAPYRRDLIRGFARVAVVVQTLAGKLHSTRLVQADRADDHIRIFDSYEDAFAFLCNASLRPVR